METTATTANPKSTFDQDKFIAAIPMLFDPIGETGSYRQDFDSMSEARDWAEDLRSKVSSDRLHVEQRNTAVRLTPLD